MEKQNAKYECVYIIDAGLSDEDRQAIIDKFAALISKNGTLESTDEWGKRKLAYPIDYKTEGYYVLVNFECAADFPAELNRVFKITDGILRYLVVKKEA